MTTEELNSFISNPSLIGEAELRKLTEYRIKFPYSPLFAALCTKGLHNLKDLSYDESLRSAAMILPDRSVLYNLIYKEPLKEKIRNVETLSEEREAEVSEETIAISHEEKEEESTTRIFDENEVELENDILIEAINTSIQLDVDQLLDVDISDSIDDWKEEQKEIDQSQLTNNSSPSKFSEWLFAMKDLNDEVADSGKSDLLSSKELIDRFIKSKPKKIDVSKDPVTPQEMGKLSLVEDDAFVTETLAEIYAKQGKYKKAIKIYEQLSLKNPEKKVFFASRIRFLREKLEYEK